MESSLSVNAADFGELKQQFVTWLKTQPQFADYELDRPGDNMNVLLGLLAYNTYQNLFYHNMATNETFLDTAQQRDSAVSRAKELNYTPRSFKSASAIVDIAVTSTNLSRSSIIIPKGTLFTTRIGDRSYSFTTDRAYVSTTSEIADSRITFAFEGVELLEGYYLTETIPYTGDTPYVIPNEQVDISSVNVVVVEDNGGVILPYKRATTLFGLDEDSQVYFIQGSPGSKYEIVFGDSAFGRKPKANSLITIDYRISNGELPNGAREFQPGQGIDGENDIIIVTQTPANSGSVFESIESIRLNAPRHFTSQGNAVTAADYASLLQETFPEIIDVVAYGGEDADPPQFGRVIVSIVLNGIDFVPDSKEKLYMDFLRARSLMKPVFVEPAFIYAKVSSTVHYDIKKTSINPDDIRTLVLAAIMNYNATELNQFDATLRFSRLGTAIDNAHASIKSNEMSIVLVRELTARDWEQGSFAVQYGVPVSSVYSDIFTYNNDNVVLEDSDGDILMRNTTNDLVVRKVGTVDYTAGVVALSTFAPDDVLNIVKLTVVPSVKDLVASKNTILKIRESDTNISVIKS
jgi:hypothetical protein